MFGGVFYYLGGRECCTIACILGLFRPLLMALEEMLPDLFVRKAKEMLQRPISCRIELP